MSEDDEPGRGDGARAARLVPFQPELRQARAPGRVSSGWLSGACTARDSSRGRARLVELLEHPQSGHLAFRDVQSGHHAREAAELAPAVSGGGKGSGASLATQRRPQGSVVIWGGGGGGGPNAWRSLSPRLATDWRAGSGAAWYGA